MLVGVGGWLDVGGWLGGCWWVGGWFSLETLDIFSCKTGENVEHVPNEEHQ